MFATPATIATADSFLAFVTNPELLRVFISLTMLGVSGGIFIVPLYAMMQNRAKPEERAQIIAANNIWNALFMVMSAVTAIVCLSILDMGIPQFFFMLAMMNLVAVCYIYCQVPNFFWRFMVWIVTHTMYRVKPKNLANIPETGGVLIVCNHVTYMDALILAGATPRPIRFLMDEDIYSLPLVKRFCDACNVIPINAEDRRSVAIALNQASERLNRGDVVCIFPEGQLTYTGEMGPFLRGIDVVLKRTNPSVKVVPIALQGLWGSYFSREGGKAILKIPKRFWSKVTVVAGDSMSTSNANSQLLHDQVSQLRDNLG